MAWKELRWRRMHDMLQQRLLNKFDADTLETRVLQSESFAPILTTWAKHMVAVNNKQITPVPQAVLEEAKKGNADVRWCLARITDDAVPKSRGQPHFPSTLLLKGPKYPFEPYEYKILKTKCGSLRGHELTTKISLPDVPPPPPKEDPKDMWLEAPRDDDDLIDMRRMPYL